ncbi:choice-of-anchor J domain-containing protein, partial [Flavobacterium sp. SM15]|uniref:choice-of-anchor J domain-containing protein n=1 Tax=Flavobacterium sp. SM15 TaxID=2908005 RepID=UPI001EDAC4ED
MQKKLHPTQSGFLWNCIDDFFSKTHEYLLHNKLKEKLLFFFLLIFSFSGYSQLSTEGFEGGIPGSWTRFQNTFGVASWTTIPDGYLGGNAAYINPASDNIGSGNTAEYYLATPLVTVPVNGEVRFLTKQGSATDNGTIYQLRMSTSSQPDIDGFNVILQTWTEAQLATTYEEKNVPIPTGIPAGLDVYFAFVAVNTQTGAVASGDSWYVDNVRVIEGCLKVEQTNFTVSNLTSNSATLSWTHPTASNFEIQVVPQGNAPAAAGTGTANSYNASLLSANTNYDVYIKTICDATTASGWVGPFPFKTLILGTRCDDPIVIAPTQAVPYVLNANLNIFQNAAVTYPTAGTGCLASGVTGNYLSGAKAFFKFTPTQTGLMTITTNPLGSAGGAGCFANTSTGTFVYQDCASVGVSCLAGMTTNAVGPKQLSNVYVQAGQTYYIVLSSNLTPTASICFNLKVEFATCAAPSVYSYKNLLQTSGLFSWNNVGNLANAWEYLVLPTAAAAPTAGTSGTPTSTNVDNPASGLTANTAYKLYVRSVCGGTPGPWSAGFPFKTQCTPFSTPYSTQFTGTSATVSEACWTPIDVNNDGLTWSYSTNTFLQTSTYQNGNHDMMASPQVNFTGVQKRLRYKYSVSGGTPTGKYSVRISTTGIGAADFVTELLPETTITNATALEKIINIPTSFTGPINIAFVVVPGTGQTATRVIIDDVFIEDKPACSDPITPIAQNITTNSADLKWVMGDVETQWEVAIQPLGSGVPTGNGTLVGVGDANVTFATPNVTYTASGLNPAIRYEYYVRAYCSSTQKSNWVGPIAFTTLCGSFNAPYTETFNDSDINTKKFCWSINDANTDNLKWAISAGGEAAISRGFAAPTGFNDWLISPVINAVGNKKLTFKYRALAHIFAPSPRHGVQVLISTTDTNPASFTEIMPWMEFYNTVYQEQSLYFTGTGPVYIAFRVPPGAPSPGTLSVLNIDDVKIEDAPACPDPSAISSALITQNSARLSWRQGYAETQWEVAIQPQGTGVPTGSGTLVGTGTPGFTFTAPNAVYNATGLAPATDYEVYVRAYCGTSNTSNWIGPIYFRTLCTPFSTPFVETFNTDSTSENCWRIKNANNDRNQWNLDVTVNPYEGNHAAGIFTGSNGANNDWLISPTINVTANQRLRYYYRVYSSDFTEDLEIRLSTNGVEVSEFTTVLYDSSSDPVLINNELYKEKIINLPAGITGNINIAWFIPTETPNPWGYRGQLLFIDKVVVEDIPACAPPSNAIAQAITDTQTQIRWDANGSETSWEISVQPYGTPAPVGATQPQYLYTATANPYTVTGLTPATRYEYYIRAICNGPQEGEWVGPFEFTTRCSFVDMCQYTIVLDNGAVGSGPAGPIQVIQNGVIVQEMRFPSSTPSTQAPPSEFIISLCNGVEFSLFWDAIGTVPNQWPNAQVRIKDASNNVIWSSVPGLGTPRRTLYTGVSSCSTVVCPQPTNIAVNSQSVLTWTAGGSETQWEVYIQPVGFGELPQSGTMVFTNSYTPQASDFTDANAATYEYFVRAVCGSGNNSFWSGPKVFVRNDDASNALVLPINANEECTVSGDVVTLVGATPSPEPMSCTGTNNGDVWFEFTATSRVHIIEANGFTGNFYISSGDEPYPDMTMTLYKVTGSGLQEMRCSNNNSIMAMYSSELIVGDTYKVRLTLNSAAPSTRQFKVCVKTPLDLCNVDAVNYDFENPPMQRVTGVSTIGTEFVVPGWRVNLDTWDAIFFNEALNTVGTGPYSGGQCIQLLADPVTSWNPSDPNVKGLYKDLDTSEATVIDYSFAHAPRQVNGSTVQLYAGPPSGPFTLVTESNPTDVNWHFNQGAYTVPVGQNTTRFIFRSKENVIGNLLDAANFKVNNEIKTADKTLTCNEVTTLVEAEGIGQWIADAANPTATIIETPNVKSTNISGFNTPGVYVYHWKTRYCDKTISITYQGINEVASVTSPANYCVTQTGSSLTANAPAGYTLMWYTQPVGGTGSTTAPTPDTSTIGSTTYYVSVVDAGGCIGPRTAITAQVNALPTATISGTTTICSGGTATVTFNGTPNATITYTVDGGANQTVTLDASGTASVTTPALTADSTYALVNVASADAGLCIQSVTDSAVITVNALPT